MGRVTSRRRVLRVDHGEPATRLDTVIAEEPLEIRVGGKPLTVTMRMPGDDSDLVAGFLLGEGAVAAGRRRRRHPLLRGHHGRRGQHVQRRRRGMRPGVPPPDPSIDRDF
jgi:FdhD protein